MHAGLSARQGHYTSHAWLGDSRVRSYSSDHEYICFNDERLTTHAFSDLATPRAREDVYALMYVREKYRSGDVGDGSESTPWARDQASQELCSKYFRGELRSTSLQSASSVERMADASASSASPAIGGVHGHGGLRASASSARGEDARQGGEVPDGDLLGNSLELRSSAASGVASSSSAAPAITSGASLGGLGSGDASESGNVHVDEDDGKGALSRSGVESSFTGTTSSCDAEAGSRMSESSRGAAAADVDLEWRRFTPRIVDESKCLARIWAGGRGGQCSHAPTDRQFCKRHAQQQNQKGWHGTVQGEIPEPKLREFLKRARQEIP